jgi:hypothetical protein
MMLVVPVVLRRARVYLLAIILGPTLIIADIDERMPEMVQATCANAIACENALQGNSATDWDLPSGSDPSILGYATDISVNQGDTVHFKVSTSATAYHLDIYRMGYYQGLGARRVASVAPSAALPQAQPPCLTDATTGLVDCGNWAESATWNVPTSAVSGIYFAKLVRSDTGGASHIVFIVRADASSSDLLFQTSDTTWQAYNDYGGNSLYSGGPVGRAYKVSYNRPFNDRDSNLSGSKNSWVFTVEYPMLRFLESNGYNVSYATGVDSDRRGVGALRSHKVFLSVGHDEYWSGAQRSNVEAARDAGVHLAFFSGNESFWKTRWEPSIDATATPYRTLVTYKETHANKRIDPLDPPTWTGTWRDPRFSIAPTLDGLAAADGGRPENGMSGNIFMVNGPVYVPMTVPSTYSQLRFWRNTAVATLAAGRIVTLYAGCWCIIGYEWDIEPDNGARPAGLIDLSASPYSVSALLLDYGSNYGSGTATHSSSLYRAPGGALVFAAGTINWAWALDGGNHAGMTSTAEPALQQATVNLLADMGVQPATVQFGLIPGMPSTDATAPNSVIASPLSGQVLAVGTPVSITGTASDAGGGVVAAVEVSTDGGTTWHRATGTRSWTYSWTPAAAGTALLRSRAVDDTLNLESPSGGISVSIGGLPPSPTATATSIASPKSRFRQRPRHLSQRAAVRVPSGAQPLFLASHHSQI